MVKIHFMALSSSWLRTPLSQGGDTGSNPVGATHLRDVGELVDPPDLGSGAVTACGFESHHPD